MWPAFHTDPEPGGGGDIVVSREQRSGMRLPRRETPTPPRELASFQGHAIDRLRRVDVDGARQLLTRMSVSFAGITSRAMCRAICVSSAKRGAPLIIVARRDDHEVVGLAIAAYDTETFWHGFFLRHPLLAAAAILKRLGHRSAPASASSSIPAVGRPTWADAGPRIAKILFVGVDARHRSRGLAARLYGDLMLRLARRGVTRVDARIGAANTASLRLHERTGWTLRPDDGVVFATRSLR
jgi:GNAT superfamily N-acetyltransferase